MLSILNQSNKVSTLEPGVQTPAVTLTSYMALDKLVNLAEPYSFIQQIYIECILCVGNCSQQRG